MANFAELDEKNTVIRVIVVGNNDCQDSNGVESEAIGVKFINSILGYQGKWVQTSYNGTFRKKYCGVGDVYYADLDAYISPPPYSSWVLNRQTCTWEAPIPAPVPNKGMKVDWDEELKAWVESPFIAATGQR